MFNFKLVTVTLVNRILYRRWRVVRRTLRSKSCSHPEPVNEYNLMSSSSNVIQRTRTSFCKQAFPFAAQQLGTHSYQKSVPRTPTIGY